MASKNRISGITIEINGDTTKLDKALRSVDGTISQTEKDLKAVDKALKLDPGNVTMLAQKQELLAKNTDSMTNKYKMLQKTLDSVKGSNVEWEKWTKQQATYSAQITKTEKTLAALEEEQKKLQKLGFAPDSEQLVEVQGKITATKETLEGLHKTVDETYEAMGRPVSVEMYEEFQRQAVSAKGAMEDAAKAEMEFSLTSGLQKFNSELGKTNSKLKEVEKNLKLDPGNVEMLAQKHQLLSKNVEDTRNRYESLERAVDEANKAFERGEMPKEELEAFNRQLVAANKEYENAAKAAREFNETAERVSAVAEKVEYGASRIANATKGISLVAAGATGGLIKMAVDAGKTADELNTLSKQTGLTVEELQKLKYAAERIDVPFDTVISSAEKMKQSMVSNSEETQSAWNRLGVAIRDNSGNLRQDIGTLLLDIAGNLSLVENETERDTLAFAIFGKRSTELTGIIDDGGEALRKYGEEAEELNLILSQDGVNAANDFNDALDKLQAVAQRAFFESGANLADQLAPKIEQIVNYLVKLLQWFANLDGATLETMLNVLMGLAIISPLASSTGKFAEGISKTMEYLPRFIGMLGKMDLKTQGIAIAFMTIAMLAGMVIAAWDDMSDLQKVVSVLGLVAAAAFTAAIALGAFQSAMSMGVAVAFIAAGILAVLAAVQSAKSSAEQIANQTKSMRPMATGGVVKPNHPFAAILGDNTQEPEIVAPYSTLYKANLDAIADSRMSEGGRSMNVTMTLDGRTFARLIAPYLSDETTRLGVSLAK